MISINCVIRYVLVIGIGITPLCANPLENLQDALRTYDPIVTKRYSLEGTVHFPEIESMLPEFYKELFKRVNIHFTVSRNNFQMSLKGKGEGLKNLIEGQFMHIEDKLRTNIMNLLQNDPLYRLKEVGANPSHFKVDRSFSDFSQEYTVMSKQAHKNTKLPEKVTFELNPNGKLLKMTVLQPPSLIDISFRSTLLEERLYFTDITLTQTKHGTKRYRSVKIAYENTRGMNVPKMITITETDSQGRPLLVSGHLNPISLVFEDITDTPVRDRSKNRGKVETE